MLKPNFIFQHFLISVNKELLGSAVPCGCTYEHSVLWKWLAAPYILCYMCAHGLFNDALTVLDSIR